MDIKEQLDAAGVGIEHYFGGGSYIKQTVIPKGARLAQHKHEHDHLSYLVRGRVLLAVNGAATRVIEAPACLTLRAGRLHEVEAMADSIWLCVWATDCTDPDKVDDVLVGTGGTG